MAYLREEWEKLLPHAFHDARANDASAAIEAARQRYERAHGAGAVSFELVVPDWPGPGWLGDQLVRPLVYFCESSGRPVPACPGVFVSLFLDGKVYFIEAGEVIRWASRILGLSPVDLLARYGTHEAETAQR
jgi:hypothetical protein